MSMIGVISHKVIDYIRGTSVVQDIKNIEKECSQSLKFLEKVQLERLINLLIFAKNYTPFYRENTDLKYIPENDIRKKCYEVIKSLPIITKEIIHNNYEMFKSQKNFRHAKSQTGGSTGQPLSYLIDMTSVSRTRAFDLFMWNKDFGYKLGDKVLVIGGSSIGGKNSLPLKIYNFLQFKKFVEGGFLSQDSVDKNLKTILYGRYDAIYAYPSSLAEYVLRAKELGYTFKGNIKGIAVTSENLLENTRLLLEQFFNAPVFSVYGARDGGIVADECIAKNGFHLNYLDCYVETQKFEDTGYINELVITNLQSYSMPFIRYRVGDFGDIDYKPCSCGLPLPKVVNLYGRSRDILLFPNGTRIHGSVFNKIILKYHVISQYQIIFNRKKNEVLVIIKTFDHYASDENLIMRLHSDLRAIIPSEISIYIDSNGVFRYTEAGKLKVLIQE